MKSKMIMLCGVCALSACGVDSASKAMLDTYRLVSPDKVSLQDQLRPGASYLHVQAGTREMFMALGSVEQTPEGPVQVWYDVNKDILRLRNGRIVGATLKTEVSWSSVSFKNLPAWNEVGESHVFERERDVSPGYRYGIKEVMQIRPISPPTDTQLQRILPASLAWFEETVQGETDLAPARYAVSKEDGGRVVYGEQCLSAEFCFSWQDWTYFSKGTH